MQVLKKVLDKLNGYAYRQEYLCLAEGTFQQPLFAYLVKDNVVVRDVTREHLFVGYCPLIFAFDDPDISEMEEVDIRFSSQSLPLNAPLKNPIAELKLRKIHQQDQNISYYAGISGRHQFISPFHQWINILNNRLHQQKAGNVYLNSRLYPQVQIGYALPRQVSLITLELNGNFNLFPTDLHGQINPRQYIISLRHAGLACKQVQQAGKIVVSAVQPSLYKTVYSLGKNHMQPLKSKEAFSFSPHHSALFNLPLPPGTVSYHELELHNSFDHGIHRVLLFNIKNQCTQPGGQPLTHIHNSYATWRLKHGLPGNYLLR